MTSLANINTLEKALVKIIFGHKIFYLSADFQNFYGTFYNFWDEKG